MKDSAQIFNIPVKQKKFLWIFCASIISVLISACATIEKPDGGPLERNPPMLESALPADSTVQFTGDRITLEFDEFVKLNNPNSQVLMNPFPKEKPELSVQGKKVKIVLKDSLLPNTTYHIYFGNAIQDITEGTAAAGLEYVFSTGATLDSCSMSGFAGDAFSNRSSDKAWVLLYKNLNDFKDTLPVYVAHVNAQGAFSFRNIAPGEYYMCALEDNNSNYRFDLPDEKIAFKNNPFILSPSAPKKDSVNLFLFTEASKNQKHLKSEIIHYHTIRSSFRSPLDNPEITFISSKADVEYHYWKDKKDTLVFWVKGDADSLSYIIRDGVFSDTIQQSLKVKGRMKDYSTDTTVRISSLTKDKIAFDRTMILSSPTPVASWQYDRIFLIRNKDTLPVIFEKMADGKGERWQLKSDLKPGENAVLTLKKGAVTDLFGYTNDSISLPFRILGESELGNIEISLSDIPGKALMVYASGKEQQVLQFEDSKTSTIEIKNILPGEYDLKIVIDENNDGKWTPGNFDERRQPEKVFTLPRPVVVKQNFLTKVSWNLKY